MAPVDIYLQIIFLSALEYLARYHFTYRFPKTKQQVHVFMQFHSDTMKWEFRFDLIISSCRGEIQPDLLINQMIFYT